MPTNITNRVIEQRTIEYDKVSPAGGAFNFRNKLINGNFDIWQRGTSLVSGTGDRYLADRWVNGSSGTTYTVSRQVFALGQTSVSNEPIYFHRTTVSSVAGSTNNAVLRQRIEGVRTLAGKTVTLSFWAKADSNKNLSVEFAQNFGTGGTPTSQIVSIGVRKLSLNNTWQKFTITTNIPTLNSNQVLGIDNNNYLNCLFWFDSGSSLNNRNDSLGHQSGTFDIAQVQLEEGPAATPFEQRPIGLELSLCQRYYEQINDVNLPHLRIDDTGGPVYFKASKRTISSIDIRNPITNAQNSARYFYNTGPTDGVNVSNFTAQTLTLEYVFIYCPNYTPPSANDARGFVNITVDAEL